MSTIINATTTNGVVIEPDNSGSLELQTNSGTTALTIDTSQNVGIGTASPVRKLDVVVANAEVARFYGTNKSIDGTGNLQVFTSTSQSTNNGGTIGIGGMNGSAGAFDPWAFATLKGAKENSTSSNLAGYLAIATSSSGGTISERMRITSGGEVYIAGTTDQGAYNLQCNGTGVWGAGAYVNGSDSRIKYDIQPISSSLEVVNKLNPVTFKYKEDWSKDQRMQTGFIAQELQETLKNKIYLEGIVNTGGEYLSVAYQNIIPLLTKAIQEQQTIINDLTARIETLEAK